jgi:hypothetical protein
VDLSTRAAPITPASFNADDNSVRAVVASENPCMVWDWERFEVVPEVLLCSGMTLPGNRQVPLLDCHARESVDNVLGSARDFQDMGNGTIEATINFSQTPEGQRAAQKVREGHLTDFSVGYKPTDSVWIPDGEKAIVGQREYAGPLKVTRSWAARELSVTPVGADEMAKARAQASPENHREEQPQPDKKGLFRMNPALKLLLVKRGLAVDATDDEAMAFLKTLNTEDQTQLRQEAGLERRPEPVNPSVVDQDAIRREAVETERQRGIQIRETCQIANMPDLADEFITRGDTIDTVRAHIFAEMKKTMKPVTPIQAGTDEREKFRSAAQDGLIIRGGGVIEKPAMGAHDLMGYSLHEIARECLRRQNLSYQGDKMAMVGRALTSSDFPYVLANVANKFLAQGYDTEEQTWKVWCGIGQTADFKANTVVRPSEYDDLDLLPESTEYKYGGRTEAKETYTMVTYGKMYAITRQAIINDDLNALTDVPRGHGEAAARKVSDLAYAVLTANAAMGDGVVLFLLATHVNLGTAGALSLTTLAEGIKMMKSQKDVAGKRRLNIRPEYFIAPVALEGTAEQFFNSGQIGGTTATDAGRAMLINPYAGSRFTRVYDPRLDDNDAQRWYLAGPKGKTVNMYFLNGNQTPFMDTEQGWEVDGIEYKVRIDAVAKAVDWRALFANNGH